MNSYLFVYGVAIYISKAKDYEINAAILCLGNVPEDFPADNMKNNGLYGYIYDFPIDYDSIEVDDFFDIQKYLTIKSNIT